MRAGLCSALLAAGLALAAPGAAQDVRDLPPGVFVDTPDGTQEVGVYASRDLTGRLRLEAGSLDDAVPVPGVVRLISTLPQWRLRGAWLSTARVLKDYRAERRALEIRARQMSLKLTFTQIVATENPERLQQLFRDVKATPENPPFVFVTLTSGGRVRDYVIALPIEP
jgi:hypothetical protein